MIEYWLPPAASAAPSNLRRFVPISSPFSASAPRSDVSLAEQGFPRHPGKLHLEARPNLHMQTVTPMGIDARSHPPRSGISWWRGGQFPQKAIVMTVSRFGKLVSSSDQAGLIVSLGVSGLTLALAR